MRTAYRQGTNKGIFFLASFFFLICLPPAAWAQGTHVVQRGESLSSIARKHHVPVSRIQEANDLEGDILRIGQSLTIPSREAGVSKAPASPAAPRRDSNPESDLPETHLVKSGDTLARLANRYSLSVRELQEMNGLKATRLRVGQVLRLKAEGGGILADRSPGSGDGPSPSPLHSQEGPGVPVPRRAIQPEEGVNSLVAAAQSFLGVKYFRGGNSVQTGFDCSAYVQKVFQAVGVELPRTAREQFGAGMEVARDALRLGDLVFFKHSKAARPAHVGIYIGNDQFIHSSTTKRKVRVDSLTSRYFAARFIGARRVQETRGQSEPKPEMDPARVSALAFEPTMSFPFFPGFPPSSQPYDPDL